MTHSHVFRSDPHTVAFQDYSEANIAWATDLDPADAAEMFYESFCAENQTLRPLPKSCAAVLRSSITCRCGNIYRRSPNFCDKCWDAYFKPVDDKIKQEAREKAHRDAIEKARKKKSKVKVDDETPTHTPRRWTPPSPKPTKPKKAKKVK